MNEAPKQPKKQFSVAVIKRDGMYEVALIEAGKLQRVLVTPSEQDLIPILFSALTGMNNGEHTTFEVTVQ